MGEANEQKRGRIHRSTLAAALTATLRVASAVAFNRVADSRACVMSVLPKMIVQYGTPRSGSTFQYILLCLLARFRTPETRCRYERSPISVYDENVVVKTHEVPLIVGAGERYLLFTSRSSKEPVLGRKVEVEQLYESFAQRPSEEVRRYSATFGLTEAEVVSVTAYMRYWSILRQCCGPQQSKTHRQQLHGCVPSLSPEATTYPACEMYNLTAVEELFASLPLFRVSPVHKVGSCARDEAQIRAGREINLTTFQGCEALAGRALHREDLNSSGTDKHGVPPVPHAPLPTPNAVLVDEQADDHFNCAFSRSGGNWSGVCHLRSGAPGVSFAESILGSANGNAEGRKRVNDIGRGGRTGDSGFRALPLPPAIAAQCPHAGDARFAWLSHRQRAVCTLLSKGSCKLERRKGLLKLLPKTSSEAARRNFIQNDYVNLCWAVDGAGRSVGLPSQSGAFKHPFILFHYDTRPLASERNAKNFLLFPKSIAVASGSTAAGVYVITLVEPEHVVYAIDVASGHMHTRFATPLRLGFPPPLSARLSSGAVRFNASLLLAFGHIAGRMGDGMMNSSIQGAFHSLPNVRMSFAYLFDASPPFAVRCATPLLSFGLSSTLEYNTYVERDTDPLSERIWLSVGYDDRATALVPLSLRALARVCVPLPLKNPRTLLTLARGGTWQASTPQWLSGVLGLKPPPMDALNQQRATRN